MDWQQLALTLLGAGVGGFVGVKAAVTRLQTQMEYVLAEIKSLRDDRHKHAGFINEHEHRITSLEKWRESK